MPRIWLRLELFELGLLPFPSKYAATITVANVRASLEALHVQFQAALQANGSGDAMMEDAGGSSFIESDNLNTVTFTFWKNAVSSIFQWREQDYKAFWLLLASFHRTIRVKESPDASTNGAVLTEEQCLMQETVPVYKIAIFLFIQTVRPHSWRMKYSLDSMNATWYREHAPVGSSLEAAASIGAQSPVVPKGSASPPPPSSPHRAGLPDRSTSDGYYLEFVREKLDDLFTLLYPSLDMMKEECNTMISADMIDLLGFLLCVSDINMVDVHDKLSTSYTKWQSVGGETSEDFQPPRVENGLKLCRFFKRHLALNETLYPPTGFTLGAAAGCSPFALNGDGDSPIQSSLPTHRIATPMVLSGFAKTTVIKLPEDFAEHEGVPDLIIFSCHDSYIYILGPIRAVCFVKSTHVMITACHNCRIITAPSTGIYSLDRCEGVQITSVSSLIRVSNCLDSRINSYTLLPLIMAGENVGVELGPFNTKYAGLTQHMVNAQFPFHADMQGAWNSFLHMESEPVAAEETGKASITLQSPASFREICVPTKLSNYSGPSERPFPLPPAYVESLRVQHDTVESLRALVCSDEFDLSAKRTLEMIVQLHFKEWLSATGNARQILDLVNIERTRAHSTDKA